MSYNFIRNRGLRCTPNITEMAKHVVFRMLEIDAQHDRLLYLKCRISFKMWYEYTQTQARTQTHKINNNKWLFKSQAPSKIHAQWWQQNQRIARNRIQSWKVTAKKLRCYSWTDFYSATRAISALARQWSINRSPPIVFAIVSGWINTGHPFWPDLLSLESHASLVWHISVRCRQNSATWYVL